MVSGVRERSGWVTFAAVMLMLVGCFNIIDGVAAITNSGYVADKLLFANLDAWGWFFVIWGIFQIVTGFAVLSGATWALITGVAMAFFNMIAQLSWAHVNSVWAIAALVIDGFVIYGLLVYGGASRSS